MDLIYFGSGAFGLPTLQALVRRHTLRAIVSQPDRPAGRGGRLTPTPIAQWASAHLPDVHILKPENVNTPEALAQIRNFDQSQPAGAPHLAAVVIAFGQKLSHAIVEGRFAINLHGSLLPRWRGAAPINAAILSGDRQVGNSVITLADRMDAGLILAQSQRELPPDLTAGELHDMLAADGPDLILSVLAAHESGALTPRAQDESLATRAPRLSRADSWVDFSNTAEHCRRRIHGLTPWPGIAVRLAGIQLKLARVQARTAHTEQPPGTILDSDTGLVACAPGTALQVLEVLPAGKRLMSWADFRRGHRINPGDAVTPTTPPPNA